ncbi:MAG TPA: DUF1934 domain-containing protein [Candidatus Acidoferrum sp.]|nr:DUF1934 domain-containing protein [Candidatus Acidoferrum sp.]
MEKAKISIKGRQFFEGGDDEVELITDGMFGREGTDYVISYDETEMTGMQGAKTTIRVTKDNTVTLHRSGGGGAAMVFEPGRRSQCHYEMESGAGLMMTVGPARVINRLSKAGGSLFVDYKLEVMGELMSKNNFLIKVENGGMTNA